MAKKKNAEDGTVSENTEAVESAETVSKEEYDKLKSEFDAQKDQFLRMAAEYDNFRKRTEKEKLAAFDNAAATIIEAFLPVADNFTLALSSCGDVDGEFRKGLEMIQKQLENAFKQLNVEEFGERGEQFDPQLHNAISRTDDEELEEDYIVSVYQKGYRIGDKIIRHAMVQVAN
ncbi:MAG: nucleotide exchange factor GrpE [Clostridia bacterium]|nr:nucleotide exchange factor GrpE [Clostridia bacterium]